MSWLSAKGCLCRQPDGWAVGKADGVCHRYPRTRFADWGSLPTGWLSAKRLLCRPQSIGSRQSRLCRLPLVAVGKEGLCRQGYSILSAKPRAVGKAPFSCSVPNTKEAKFQPQISSGLIFVWTIQSESNRFCQVFQIYTRIFQIGKPKSTRRCPGPNWVRIKIHKAQQSKSNTKSD